MKKKNKDSFLVWFWFFFLLFIPSQLGKHFWLKESYVSGIRVDYLSPTLFFLDLIWLVLFLVETKKRGLSFKSWSKKKIFWIILVVGINIWWSTRKWLSLYGWLRWGQLIWTIGIIEKEKRVVWKLIERCIPWWILSEVILGLVQIFKEGSVGGVWWWWGERSFSLINPGIAKIGIEGRSVLRAYGTFSHPNSLAGFLLVSLILWWSFRKRKDIYQKIWWWVVWWVGVIGLLITASRTVWLVGAGMGIWQIVKKKVKGWKGLVGLVLVGAGLGMIVMGMANLVGGWDVVSVEKRIGLLKIGGRMVKDFPVWGVGMKNMVGRLVEYWPSEPIIRGWLQPVHNVYLLLLTEIGILGFLVGGWLAIKKLVKRKRRKEAIWLAWLVIGLTGWTDHYWLTLNQNWWLMGIIWGLL
jgi:hypothetical protein